mmetsp:Transcript_25262/g.53855  ORF Transcript_25262/g.53855 Transcript_25262/m.53855 type:complete len:138 (+) Transcript_25262:2-415(+)
MFRGKKPRENTANKKLLDEVKKRCEEWNKLPDGKQKRAIKKQILTDVVEWWKGEGGRFLKKRESDSKWQEVTDSTVARETVCQQFRDISNKAKKRVEREKRQARHQWVRTQNNCPTTPRDHPKKEQWRKNRGNGLMV